MNRDQKAATKAARYCPILRADKEIREEDHPSSVVTDDAHALP